MRQFSVTMAWCLWASAAHATLSPDQRDFVEDLAARHGFEQAYLARIIGEARHDDGIIAAITRPAEAMPWHRYRRIFLTEDRIAGGVDYWQAHAATLQEAEETYGVPPHLITAIIGVETRYGANTGKHRVADALKTLGFGYPPRAGFFRKEFEEFLLMTREERMDPLAPLGSYAGAMGKPQFIPSSFRSYAVDFDGDGRRDLWQSDADVIGSIANYFDRHGWQPDMPVAIPLDGDVVTLGGIGNGGSKPDRTLGEIAQAGARIPGQPDESRRAVVVELEQENGPEFWAGFDNFYVITRYNHSNLYAMAVYQLGEAIRERHTAISGKIDR